MQNDIRFFLQMSVVFTVLFLNELNSSNRSMSLLARIWLNSIQYGMRMLKTISFIIKENHKNKC